MLSKCWLRAAGRRACAYAAAAAAAVGQRLCVLGALWSATRRCGIPCASCLKVGVSLGVVQYRRSCQHSRTLCQLLLPLCGSSGARRPTQTRGVPAGCLGPCTLYPLKQPRPSGLWPQKLCPSTPHLQVLSRTICKDTFASSNLSAHPSSPGAVPDDYRKECMATPRTGSFVHLHLVRFAAVYLLSIASLSRAV